MNMVMLIPCPACDHPCSEAAPTCPRCGHPIKQKPKFQQDIEDIKKVFSWIGLGLLLPTIAAPTVIVRVLEPNKLNEPAAQAIWNICVLTAPLTLGLFTIGTLATARDKLPQQARSWNGFWGIVGSVAAILGGSAWILQKLFNISSINFPQMWQSCFPNLSIYNYIPKLICLLYIVLSGYWNFYGPLKFFSSLLVAWLLIWIWTQKLWSHVRDAVVRLVKRLMELVKKLAS
ncbi:MAG TPA: hypothetical protein VL134_14315 [Leptolyngbya sp.]|nr:hypothetical protein [Leptolyngbya sp.]